MSGSALAQQMIRSKIEKGREDRYQTLGDHEKILEHNHGTYLKCMECKEEFVYDKMGVDIAKNTECDY